MTTHGQRQRILDHLLVSGEVPAVVLHRIGSGKENGWCSSFSRRISEIREQGFDVRCRKETQPNGQMHTFYTLVKQP